jgi:AhpD family alkylhydroperoxidase
MADVFHRLDVSAASPPAWSAMSRFNREAARFGPEPAILELVRIRASQINGCAYCIDMHTKDARVAGESEERMQLIVAWRESPAFSTRERAALALAESMTRLADGGVSDEVYDAAAGEFSEAELAGLIFTITGINAWNRIAITTRMERGHYRPGPAHQS